MAYGYFLEEKQLIPIDKFSHLLLVCSFGAGAVGIIKFFVGTHTSWMSSAAQYLGWEYFISGIIWFVYATWYKLHSMPQKNEEDHFEEYDEERIYR